MCMKKIFVLVSTVLLAFGMIGCARKTYELPWDQFCHDTNTSSTIELKIGDKKHIIDLLNKASWTNDVSNCGEDFIFYTQKQEVRYCSVCGIFTDITNKKSTTVLEEERILINTALGVNRSKHI